MRTDPEIAAHLRRLPIEFGKFGFDEFGVSRKAIGQFYTPFAWFYRHYLNVTTFGIDNVPANGPALLIGNHSGGIGVDAAMTMTSLILNRDTPRLAHGMAEYLFNRWPFTSILMSRVGHLTGLPEHGERLLGAGRIVVAFPEGARGTGKLYKDRYKLVRFGTGFMRLAMRCGVPIVPFAFVGGEETFPTLFHLKKLARLVGAPYVPVAPHLLLFPLPVSCQIHFGAPLRFPGDGSESDEDVAANVATVKEHVAQLIASGLELRPSAFTRDAVPSPYDPTRSA